MDASRLFPPTTPPEVPYPKLLYSRQRVAVAMSKQGTVVEQKQLFLLSRKQLLSRGIAPSERLKTIADDGGIELSVLKGALDKGRHLIATSQSCKTNLASQPRP
jgi:hypothetical protein